MAEIKKDVRQRMSDAIKILGQKRTDEEWEYFQKNARNFEKLELDPNKKYGILIQNSSPSEKNMLYAPDTALLRTLHLEALADGRGDSAGAQVRKHLDWLERVERKQ